MIIYLITIYLAIVIRVSNIRIIICPVLKYQNSHRYYPDVKKIILIMDNLNTHNPFSLYKKFKPYEARHILRKLEIHYTLKQESWLNIAEIELNVMIRQCLYHRINSI